MDFFRNLLSEEGIEDLNGLDVNKFSETKKLQIATCALFLEVALADDKFAESEKNKIYEVMQNTFGLNKDEASKLIEMTQERVDKSVSIYEFTDVLNSILNDDQKYEILKNLWLIVFADEKMDRYEDHVMKLIGGNFRLDHRDIITAKAEAKRELGIS